MSSENAQGIGATRSGHRNEVRRLERQRNGGKPDPIKIENALRKIAKTWSNFLAFTILMGCARKTNIWRLQDLVKFSV